MDPFWNVNFGHIVLLTSWAGSMVVFWTKMADRIENLQKTALEQNGKIEKHAESLAEFAQTGLLTTINQHERRITSIENCLGDLHEMKADIKWLKRNLEGRTQ